MGSLKIIFTCVLVVFSITKVLPQPPSSIVWEANFDFKLDGRQIFKPKTDQLDNVYEWHENKRDLLKNAFLNGGKRNFAVARVGFVYSIPDGENLYVTYIQLPFLFISGWKAPDDRKYIGKNFNKIMGEATKYDPNNFCFLGGKKGFFSQKDGDIKYAKYLKNIFSSKAQGAQLHDGGEPNRFITKSLFLNTLLLQNDTYTYNIRDPDQNDLFSYRFYDTEQIIYLVTADGFRHTNTNKLRDFFNKSNPQGVPDNAKIHLCKLDIASYKDMCIDCGDTGYALLQTIRGFEDMVNRTLELWSTSSSNSNFTIDPKFRSFIEVSGQRPSLVEDYLSDDSQEWYSRSEENGFRQFDKDSAAFEARTVMPRIVHVALPEKIL